MIIGFETAWSEITLVLFTTLAPSGTLAFLIISLYLIISKLSDSERRSINKFLVIPLIVSTVGLVASATHLGNPSNALYVFMRVGQSPLSNEVFCAVIFLMFSGLYWLSSFSEKSRVRFQKIWLVVTIVAGLVYITSIAFAYNVETIISWYVPLVPINLWLNALVGGPLLALLTLQVAKAPSFGARRFARNLCLVSFVALVLNAVSMLIQNAGLPQIRNSIISAVDLVPFYPLLIGVYVVLCLVAILIYARPLMRNKLPRLRWAIISCALVFLGIFLTRLAFYMMYMTMGLSL